MTVVGVHSAKFSNEREDASLLNAVLRYNIEHPVVNDQDMRVWRALGVQSWPTLMVVGPTGKLIATLQGEGHRQVRGARTACLTLSTLHCVTVCCCSPARVSSQGHAHAPTWLQKIARFGGCRISRGQRRQEAVRRAHRRCWLEAVGANGAPQCR